MYTISDAINLAGFAIAIVLLFNWLPTTEPIKSSIELLVAIAVGYMYYQGKKARTSRK